MAWTLMIIGIAGLIIGTVRVLNIESLEKPKSPYNNEIALMTFGGGALCLILGAITQWIQTLHP